MRGSDTCELVFDNCEVPETNVLNEVGRGVNVLMSGLDYERVVLAAGKADVVKAQLTGSIIGNSLLIVAMIALSRLTIGWNTWFIAGLMLLGGIALGGAAGALLARSRRRAVVAVMRPFLPPVQLRGKGHQAACRRG